MKDLVRDFGKSDTADRKLPLPAFVALMAMRPDGVHPAPVFPPDTGGWRDPVSAA